MDLFLIEGTSRKYWGAALEGAVLHTAWGRIDGVLQTKRTKLPSAAAARAEYEALVAAKRKKGYLDGRPRPGSPTFLAEGHAHADVVWVNAGGGLSCSQCDEAVAKVRIGPAPERPPPRPAVTTKPTKKEPTGELKRELAKLERSAWSEGTSARARDSLDRRIAKLTEKIDIIEAKNAGRTVRALALGPVPAVALQAEMLWPLAAEMRPGSVMTAASVVARAGKRYAASDHARRSAKAAEASAVNVWNARVAAGKASDVDRIGGAPGWIDAEAWPSCKSCGEEMEFIGQLAAGPGTPIPLRKGRRIFLFECEDHCIVRGAQGVVIQAAGMPGPSRKGRRSSPPLPILSLTFTKSREGAPAVDDTGEIETELAPDTIVGHQTKIGGHPIWIQSPASAKCNVCKKKMSFIAQIDAEMHPRTRDHPLFGDVGSFYVFLCLADEVGHVEFQCS